jgi:penicillin-binding protein 2
VPFPEVEGERGQRAMALLGFTGVVLLILAGRLFQLQILRGDDFAVQAETNMVREEYLPPQRGRLFDRHGELLADNRASFNLNLDAGHPLYADRQVFRAAIDSLASLLGRDAAELERRAARYRRMYAPLLLRRDMKYVELAPFVERTEPLPGLTIGRTPLRRNPHGTLAAHVLGYVGEISEEELADDDDTHYAAGALVGRAGIERQYESLLRGGKGKTCVRVDAMGRKTDLFEGRWVEPARPGIDLELTLDARLQRVAEEALARARREHGPQDGTPRGAVVALDPWTGEVLVCASAPSFDPRDFAHGLTHAEWAALNDDEAHPLLNRAVQAAYPPASLFKIVTTLAGLHAGIVSDDLVLEPCWGQYRFGDRTFRCWKTTGHGSVDLGGAFEQSCDVYYYQVARMLGLERFLDYIGSFGLDERTGIDLPDEREGLVPSMEWYRRRLGTRPPEGNVLNLAIGQGEILLTPLQMASFVGALVSDGVVRRPRIARRARRRDGTLVWERAEPEEVRRLGVPDADRAYLRELLERAVAGEHGTGHLARVAGARVGGKTGTAEHPRGEDHALFIGITPVDRPEIVVVAVVEEAGHGGVVAAPIVRAVLEAHIGGIAASAAPDSVGARQG